MMRAGLATFLFYVLAHNAAAASTCLTDAVATYYQAKIEFQRGMFDLIAQRAPDLTELAAAGRDHQIALAERRQRQLSFLEQTSPDRLVTDGGVSRLVNFEWTEADLAAWLQADPEAAALQARIQRLETKLRDHPDWPALRELVRSSLQQSSEFAALVAALGKAGGKTGKAVEACS